MFIGNIPFIVSEEELRSFFVPCGEIENVRLVRDPKTFLGKGIGYVMFKTKEAMQKAIKEMDGAKFKNRELRVKKAVDPQRREKKFRKIQDKIEAKKRGDDNLPNNFEDAYESPDESGDEKLPKVVDLRKDANDKQSHQELKLENIIAFNKRKHQQMLKNMIANQQSHAKSNA